MDTVRLLLRYLIIEAQEAVQEGYMMHPVVHRWTAHIKNDEEKREFLQLAMIVIGSIVPSSNQGKLPEASSSSNFRRCWVSEEVPLTREYFVRGTTEEAGA